MGAGLKLRMLAPDVAFAVVGGGSSKLEAHLRAVPADELWISAMTRAELASALIDLAEHAAAVRVREFLKIVRTLPWDAPAADEYARLLARLAQEGVTAGEKDVAVAAHAAASGAVLSTAMPSLFQRISPGMALEDWS